MSAGLVNERVHVHNVRLEFDNDISVNTFDRLVLAL